MPADDRKHTRREYTMAQTEDREYDASVTAPSIEAVIMTRLLELPEFERTASIDAVADSVNPEGGTTVQVERST